VVLLVTLPAVVVTPSASDAFRLPKLLLCELLALLSLLFLSWRLRSVEKVDWRRLFRHPAFLAVAPFVVVASLSFFWSDHPRHVAQAVPSLWIGAAALVGWSLALRPGEHPAVLRALAVPAAVLSVVAVGQFHGVFSPFDFRDPLQERIRITSLAGGAFDLAAYLVLPALIAQLALRRSGRRWWLWGVVLALAIYAIAVTQTLSAVLALLAGTFVLQLTLVPWRRVAAATAVIAVLAVVVGLGVEPLRQRLDTKVASLRSGDLNRVLTGRLDGWRAAVWMFRQEPLTGIGHGAYRAEFGTAKLALLEEGKHFYRRQHQPYFSNAHNEFLEVAAETGWLGVMALLWGVGWLARELARRWREAAGSERRRRRVGLMAAGVVALLVLAVTNFPLRLGLVAYPYLFLLSWVFAGGGEAEG
jgi:O-antigen ligase